MVYSKLMISDNIVRERAKIMNIEKKDAIDLKKTIINDLNAIIKKSISESEYYKLEKVFYNESDLISEKDFEDIINYYLEKISDFTIKEIEPFFLEIEKISSYFDYAYFAYDNEIKRDLYKIQECAEKIADDLIAKCCKVSDRTIKRPIYLSELIMYGLSYKVNTKEINKAVMWIILRLAVSYFLLTDK